MILKISFSAELMDICFENIISNSLLIGVVLVVKVSICDVSDNRENII